MIIELIPEHPRLRENVTTAYGSEFANLIRQLEKNKDFKKIEGQFSIYKGKRGHIEIDFGMKEGEGE